MRTRLVFLSLLLGSHALQAAGVLERPEMHRFLDRMVSEHGIPRAELETLFVQVETDPRVIERITRPAEALPWYRYRRIFITEARIREGVAFWNRHADTLARAEREYGVPPEIVTAVIGVETHYGRHRGGFPVITALTTLGLDYPRRSRFFLRELEEFLLLARSEGLDPLGVMGSYAGAMGQPQFIASSYRRYAVDFNGDGVRDLFDDTEDAIGSVANYLRLHGWRPGEAVAFPAQVSGPGAKTLAQAGYKPHLPAARLEEYGVRPVAPLPADVRVALVALEQPDDRREHWVVLPNFYVITRYNHSPLYAMAVYQLAEAIARGFKASPARVAVSD